MQEFEASGGGKTSTQFRKYLKMKTANINNQNRNIAINNPLLRKPDTI